MEFKNWMSPLSKPIIHFLGIADPVSFKKLQEQLEQIEQQLQVQPPLHLLPPEKPSEKIKAKKKKYKKNFTQKILPFLGYFDSDPATSLVLKESLKNRFSLKNFSNWESLVKKLPKKTMPYFFVDLASIGNRGLKSLKLLREKSPKTKIIALSSYLSAGLAKNMPKPLLFEEILQKPLQKEQLNKLK